MMSMKDYGGSRAMSLRAWWILIGLMAAVAGLCFTAFLKPEDRVTKMHRLNDELHRVVDRRDTFIRDWQQDCQRGGKTLQVQPIGELGCMSQGPPQEPQAKPK